MDKKRVIEALKEVYDPEIPINIYDLGLIYDVSIEGGRIKVVMTMTAPGCPMAYYVVKMVEDRLRKLDDVEDVEVELTWDPPWSPDKATEEGKKKLRELFPWLFEKKL